LVVVVAYIYVEQCIQEIANSVTSSPVSDLYLTRRSCLICNLHVPEKSYSKSVPAYPIPETEEIFYCKQTSLQIPWEKILKKLTREIHVHKTTGKI
jgi:hypothetical protein